MLFVCKPTVAGRKVRTLLHGRVKQHIYTVCHKNMQSRDAVCTQITVGVIKEGRVNMHVHNIPAEYSLPYLCDSEDNTTIREL